MIGFIKRFFRSVRYALRGIAIVWREEQNFRIEVLFSFVVIILSIFFKITRYEATIILFMIGLVLLLEVMNAVVERLVDLNKPRLHHYAQAIKELMAGVVLLSALLSAIVGIIIFLPYIF